MSPGEAEVEVVVFLDGTNATSIAGAVFVKGAPAGVKPVVDSVQCRLSTQAVFRVVPGPYVLRFHVEEGDTKFSLVVRSGADELSRVDVDPSLATTGWVARFTIG